MAKCGNGRNGSKGDRGTKNKQLRSTELMVLPRKTRPKQKSLPGMEKRYVPVTSTHVAGWPKQAGSGSHKDSHSGSDVQASKGDSHNKGSRKGNKTKPHTTLQSEVDLLPCPFCSSSDVRVSQIYTKRGNYAQVVCRGCRSMGPRSAPIVAMQAWNQTFEATGQPSLS